MGDEGIDLMKQMSNAYQLLGLFAKNPQALQNPILRRLLFKVMSALGMSTTELDNAQAELDESMQAQPGLMPGMPGQPTPQPQPAAAAAPVPAGVV
jgi:hypothetical protein